MKKTLNIVLLCFVLIVWGIILYRLTEQYFWPTNQLADNYEKTIDTSLKFPVRDTFEMRTSFRDPFLKTVYLEKKSLPKRSFTKYKPKTTAVTPWPQIKYFGFIKSKDRKGELVLLQINNELHRARVGEKVADIQIKKIYRDSILLSCKNINKIIRLQ